VFFKTASRSSPADLVLYGAVWPGAELGRSVRALRSVQGTIFILGALWGLTKAVTG